MPTLEIIMVGMDNKEILRKMSEKVDLAEIVNIQPLIDDMIETVNSIGALGLAAPQVGINKRLFVLGKDMGNLVCINPEIIGKSGRAYSYAEGCLSIDKGKRFDIKRYKEVILKYLDRYGGSHILKPKKKLFNFAIQHEIDHLNGKLICD